jgi:hypothetical protein
MTKYIVHLYREMKLSYTGIEADTPEAAAAIAGGKPTDDADNVEDCDGDNLAALVDVAGDEDYSQSVSIDFEPERHRKAASVLLTALERAEFLMNRVSAGDHQALENLPSATDQAQAAIAEAKAADVTPGTCASGTPARFEMEHDPQENPDRAYVLVDGLFDVAILRTGEAIVIDVYPKDWIDPIDTMTVWDEQVAEALADAETDEAKEA